tara:strand:- start:414 stop:605 length:192 start_codon:yes stop_codon:yes gene_type:complete
MITLANQKTIETMSRLLRNDFDKIDFSLEYIYNKAETLINTAHECGLYELAMDMETDKQTELC